MNGSRDELASGTDIESALWMLAQLPSDAQDRVRRSLAMRREPALAPHDDQTREFGLVAELLRSKAPRPGWSFAYVARKQYDAHRTTRQSSSASLVARYGSWTEVCRRAYALLAREQDANARLIPRRLGRQPAARMPYSASEATVALRECAHELGRPPSRNAYSHWRAAAQKRRQPMRTYPSASIITHLYSQRGGWRGALEQAELLSSPKTTVRVTTAARGDAVVLVDVLRSAGHVAAYVNGTNWIEVLGTLANVKSLLQVLASDIGSTRLALWEPCTETLDFVDLKGR
jgi:hypothetical protein